MSQKIKILIATDGSTSSLDAVRYTGGFFDPQTTEITLIHIIPDMSEPAAELPPETLHQTGEGETDAGYLKMKESVSILETAGYDKQFVTVKIQNEARGVTNDIVAEFENGYDALIIGRRGLNDHTDIMVGATAYRMMKAVKNLPVVIVGECPDPENVLIGFDGSGNAFKALDCVCRLMLRPLRKYLLCHVLQVAEHDDSDEKALSPDRKKEGMDKQRNRIETDMQLAADRLEEAGVERSLIETEILTSRVSRALAISKTAESRHCGSIVVGRRGLSMIRDFMMGRVTMKVLHRAHTQAVWIV